MGSCRDGLTLRSDVQHRIDAMIIFAFLSIASFFFFAANFCTAVSRHSFPSFPTNYTPNLQFEIVRLDQIDSR